MNCCPAALCDTPSCLVTLQTSKSQCTRIQEVDVVMLMPPSSMLWLLTYSAQSLPVTLLHDIVCLANSAGAAFLLFGLLYDRMAQRQGAPACC